MTDDSAAIKDVLAAFLLRGQHRSRSSEKDWLPNDPLFEQHEWKKIKDSLGTLPPSIDFGSISDALMVCVGNYRAAVLNERPEKITGHRYVSDKNRNKLQRAIKVFEGVKSIFTGSSTLDHRTKNTYLKEAHLRLQHHLLLELISTHDASAYEKIPDIIQWLEQGTTTMDIQDFNAVMDVIIDVHQKQKEAASKTGAPAKQARNDLLSQLDNIWSKATGARAKASRTFDGEEVVSLFGNFAEAVLVPISKQLDDQVDVCALRDAVWVYCNKKVK